MTVEEIQNQVEVALMAEKYYAVAKSYMLYRQRHLEDREVKSKLEFLMNYCSAENAASGSKFDANANVESKNIATLIGELPKQNFIRLNRRLLTDRLKEMYGKEFADRYIYLLEHHFIYKNDETSLANYCASITMYPWLLNGTMAIGGNSKAPTNLKSFCGGFINMVFMVSSMLSGACATPEFLMYMNYFIEKEYGEDYYKNTDKVVDLSIRQRTLDKVICDYFEVNGLVEAAEYLDIEINDNPDYERFVKDVLGIVEKCNKKYKTKELMFNCEMIPAENVGVKHAKWDKEDGYKVNRECYNSYFYKVEDNSLNVIDKFRLHGKRYIEHLTGGSALHLNLEEHLSKEQYRQLLKVAAIEGCNYFTFNIPNTICNDCGHIDKRYLKECPVCHSKNVDYLTRVIGYMKRVSNFSAARQKEAEKRYYINVNEPKEVESKESLTV
jgi:anaerobic ribonucleoside-triphosphate reductase